jgi:hypothetical protein
MSGEMTFTSSSHPEQKFFLKDYSRLSSGLKVARAWKVHDFVRQLI